MKIIIETIPHSKQRYPTAGDWYWKRGVLHIKVSKLSDWRREVCVAIHELAEVMACKYAGVKQEDVDKFDMEFEKRRPAGCVDEPGDHKDAPYRKQHCFATGIERLLAAVLGVSWADYEEELDLL
jgi:hypothetical protein